MGAGALMASLARRGILFTGDAETQRKIDQKQEQ
jgi:hypothetical protein